MTSLNMDFRSCEWHAPFICRFFNQVKSSISVHGQLLFQQGVSAVPHFAVVPCYLFTSGGILSLQERNQQWWHSYWKALWKAFVCWEIAHLFIPDCFTMFLITSVKTTFESHHWQWDCGDNLYKNHPLMLFCSYSYASLFISMWKIIRQC